jgi:hypothetical protein
LDEQPERAPAGAPLELPDKRLAKVDICFSTFLLSHFLQTTLSPFHNLCIDIHK